MVSLCEDPIQQSLKCKRGSSFLSGHQRINAVFLNRGQRYNLFVFYFVVRWWQIKGLVVSEALILLLYCFLSVHILLSLHFILFF